MKELALQLVNVENKSAAETAQAFLTSKGLLND